MHSTRRLLSPLSGLSSSSKLLLPPPTFTEIISSAAAGAWQHLVDQPSRDAYEKAIEEGVIKDTVLHNATNGSVLTYSLFHNLQNPLFSEYKFNSKEFVDAVAPALENFHDVLGKLRNQLPATLKEMDEDKKEPASQEEIMAQLSSNSLAEALLGKNHWRDQAKADPDSLAGVLSRMTTEVCLDALYYTSKLDILTATQGNFLYKSCTVNEVALLSARAAVLRDDENPLDHEEFRATEELYRKQPVGAQLDVLFEVTHEFEPDVDAQAAGEKETLTVTNLAVAVFEGWLYGGPERDLRWRVALIREAFEFPHSASVTRQ